MDLIPVFLSVHFFKIMGQLINFIIYNIPLQATRRHP